MPLKRNGFGVVDVVFFCPPFGVSLGKDSSMMYRHVERLDSTVIYHRKKNKSWRVGIILQN
jgi:hypothetical protein